MPLVTTYPSSTTFPSSTLFPGSTFVGEQSYGEIGVEVEVYSYADPTVFKDVLQARVSPTFLEEIKGPGGGSFNISVYDPKIIEDPSLLDYRNVLRFKVNGVEVGAMLLQNKTTLFISEETREEVYRISGESLRTWLSDAVVLPKGGLKSTSKENRFFNFASEVGSWYNPASWVTPQNMVKVSNYTNANPKRNFPADWPDAPDAWWIWTPGSTMTTTAPGGDVYFRSTFNIATAGNYSFFFTVDDFYDIYLDGELLSQQREWSVHTWKQTQRVDFELTTGEHVIGIKATNRPSWPSTNPAGLVAALFLAGDASVPSSAQIVMQSGDSTWKCLPYPAQAPGWTAGELMLTLLSEADARGVKFPEWLTPSFTATTDSNGVAWDRSLDWSFAIGEKYTSVVEKLEELVCDVWIDSSTMTLNMAATRGTNRTVYGPGDVVPVVFEKGKNLLEATQQGQSDVTNQLLIRTEDGWVVSSASPATNSQTKYGVVESSLESSTTTEVAQELATAIFAQKALPEEGASYKIIPFDGAIPFVDFQVGDWVIAPDGRGVPTSRRVMSIAITEDDAGNPEYSVEFDTIFRDAEERMARWLARQGAAGSMGGSIANAGGGLPPSYVQPTPQPLPPVLTPAFPLAPDSLSGSSTGTWSADGVNPLASATLTWAAVVLNTDGSATVPEIYEVWGFDTDAVQPAENMLASTSATTATLSNFVPGSEWQFRVRAKNVDGNYSQFSAPFFLTMIGPDYAMSAPAAPTLSSQAGLLGVTWDGLLGGIVPPPQFRYVYASVATSSGGVYSKMGAVLQRDGRSISIPGLTVGTTYWVKLTAVDGVGVESDPSPASSILLSGVDLGDLDTAVTDAIDAANQAAIEAKTTQNLLFDSSFEDNNETHWDYAASGVTNVTTAPFEGTRHLRIASQAAPYTAVTYVDAVSCSPGDELVFWVWVRAEETGVEDFVESALEIGVKYGTTDTTPTTLALNTTADLTTTGYTQTVAFWTVPADTYFFRPYLSVADTSNDNVYYVDGFKGYHRIGTTQIVDGSVVSDKLAAESVVAGKLAAGSVATENLQAGSVVAETIASEQITAEHLTVGAVTADAIAAGAIQTNHLSPTVGGELDISANDSVQIIVGQIGGVQDQVNATNSSFEEMQTYYSFGVDGAVVSKPGSPFALALRNDRVEMLENGNVVSYWNSGQMVVTQFVGEQVILGNHQLEKYNDGTVVRAV